MSDRSFGDYTNRNIVKNPLLSSAVTGLSLDDLTHKAVLLPVAPAQGQILRSDQNQTKQHSLGDTHRSNKIHPHGDTLTDIPSSITSQNINTNVYSTQNNVKNAETHQQVRSIQSKASAKSEDDDFDVNEYIARLQGTRYVSAPLHSHIKDDLTTLRNQEENLEEINLNEVNEAPNVEAVQQSFSTDLAQNFSQLPAVLPHVASAVFSSFSNMLNLRSREQVTDDAKVVEVQKGLAVPVVEEAPKELAPPPKEPPVVTGPGNYRLPTKKKYAQIPGLSSGETHNTPFNQPGTQTVPSFFTPDSNYGKEPQDLKPNVFNPVESQNVYNASTDQQNVYNASTDQQNVYNASTDQQNVYNASTDQQNVYNASTDQQNVYNASVNEQNVYNVGANEHNVYNPIAQHSVLASNPIDSQQNKNRSLNQNSDNTFFIPDVTPNAQIDNNIVSPPANASDIKPYAFTIDTTLQPNPPAQESTSIIPPPPMFSARKDSQTAIGKSILPPSVARRISANQPIIKQQNASQVPTENIFIPTMVEQGYNIDGKASHTPSQTSQYSALGAQNLSTNMSVPLTENLYTSSQYPPTNQTSSVPQTPLANQAIGQPLAQAPPLIAQASPMTGQASPMLAQQPPIRAQEPRHVQIPSPDHSAFKPLPASETKSFAKTHERFTPVLPPTEYKDTPSKPDGTGNTEVPLFFTPKAEKVGDELNTAFNLPTSTMTPANIFDPAANANPAPFFTQSQANTPSLFQPTPPILQYSEEQTEPPKPLAEPPKATGNINFRMTKKRPQYYSGPIEGVGSISNNVKPTIPVAMATGNQANIFTPEAPVAMTPVFAPAEDMNKVGMTSNVFAPNPYSEDNKGENIVPNIEGANFPPMQTAQMKSFEYPTQDVAQPFDISKPYVQDTYTQNYNTSFDLSRSTTDKFEQPKESSFGIIGSLKSKLSAIDINKIQNKVTTFFDPAYNDTKKPEETAKQNEPYQQGYGQSNFNIFVPTPEQNQYNQFNYQNTGYNYDYYQNQYSYGQYDYSTGQYAAGHRNPVANTGQNIGALSQTTGSQNIPFESNTSYSTAGNVNYYAPIAKAEDKNSEHKDLNNSANDDIINVSAIEIATDVLRDIDDKNEEMLKHPQETVGKIVSQFDMIRTVDKDNTTNVFQKLNDPYKASAFFDKSSIFNPTEEFNLRPQEPNKVIDFFNPQTEIGNKTQNQDVTDKMAALAINKQFEAENFSKDERIIHKIISNVADKNETNPDIVSSTSRQQQKEMTAELTAKQSTLIESLSKPDIPIVGVSTVPLFGLSAIIADKSKENEESANVPTFDSFANNSSLFRNTDASFFENLDSAKEKAKELPIRNISDVKNVLLIEPPQENICALLKRNASSNKLEDLDKKYEDIATKPDDITENVNLLFDNSKNDFIKQFIHTADSVFSTEVKEPITVELNRETNTEDFTTQLIDNLTSPIQLSNPVEALLADIIENKATAAENNSELNKITNITEDTMEIRQAQSATGLLDNTPINDIKDYGWNTDFTPTNMFNTNEADNFGLKMETPQGFDFNEPQEYDQGNFGFSLNPAHQTYDYKLDQSTQNFDFQIDPNSIGFFSDNSLFFENVPKNASDEIKAEFQAAPEISPRESSEPSAPEEDTKSDETGGLDVHSIEQDAKKDFPIDEEFVIEPSETDDDKMEFRERERSSETSSLSDTFTNRVERFQKETDYDQNHSYCAPKSMASYFDTGNYAVEAHFKNSFTSPSSSSNSMRIPPGFEEEYRRKINAISLVTNESMPLPQSIPDTSTQTKSTSSVSYSRPGTKSPDVLTFSVANQPPTTATMTFVANQMFEDANQTVGNTIPVIEEANQVASIEKDSDVSANEEPSPNQQPSVANPMNFVANEMPAGENQELKSTNHPVPTNQQFIPTNQLPSFTEGFTPKVANEGLKNSDQSLGNVLKTTAKAEEVKKLQDPMNFFSSDEPKAETGDFNRLASYFSQSGPKPDHSKSFFELSESQNHYRHDGHEKRTIVNENKTKNDGGVVGKIEVMASNTEASAQKPFFELSSSQNHYMDAETRRNIAELMLDLTSAQNLTQNEQVKTVNYFTLGFGKQEPRFINIKEFVDQPRNCNFKTNDNRVSDDGRNVKTHDGHVLTPNDVRNLKINDDPNLTKDDHNSKTKDDQNSKTNDNIDPKDSVSDENEDLHKKSEPNELIDEIDIANRCVDCNNILKGHYSIRTVVNNTDNKEGDVPRDDKRDIKRPSLASKMDSQDQEYNIEDDQNSGVNILQESHSSEYTPVKPHWFYRVDVDDKSVWRGFSLNDSKALEDAYHCPDLNENTLVPTDGGRFDVNVVGRLRVAVYWKEKPTNVRRCSWFYKGTTDARYVPYTELVAEKLEEEYRHGITTGEWHRRLALPNNEMVIMHGPAVMVHFLYGGAADAFTSSTIFHGKKVYRSTPKIKVASDQNPSIDHLVFMVHGCGEYKRNQEEETSSRPRVVRRGHEESSIEDSAPAAIEHLLLLCHGVGSACDMRFRSLEEVVEDFRTTSFQLLQSHYKNSYDSGVVNRVEVLPISWHSQLHSGEAGVDNRLSKITLDSIPRLRAFTNHTVLDVLFYTSPVYHQTIMDTVCSELNRVYSLFKRRNPHFKGGVSLGGHSLGSVILYDLLCHQDVQGNLQANSPSKSFMSGVKVDDTIKYPVLAFSPEALYALGSPIAIFECIRGVESLGLDFCLPTCKKFFNIFHPYDPIAYRIEPLINEQLQDVKPYLIPHHKGRKRMHLELKDTMARVGADLKQKLVESLKTTWNKWKATPPTDGQLEKVVEEEIEKENLCEENKEEIPNVEPPAGWLGRLNAGARVDYVLQEAPLEMINEYLFAMSSHVGYWESEDTMLLMLREIYSDLGVAPDCSVPQHGLSVQRTRNMDEASIVFEKEHPSTSRGNT